jgi:addiction module RelE/StbE family toxin
MLLVEWRPDAEDDLLKILNYIAEVNFQAAADLQIQVDQALRHLGSNPYLYKSSDKVEGAREIVISPNYILFYQVGHKIEVLTIVHARQQIPKLKKPLGFTPVAFKGAWLIKPNLPRRLSLLEQSQH